MYNEQLVYKVVIWAFLGISLWKEKVALMMSNSCYVYIYMPAIMCYIGIPNIPLPTLSQIPRIPGLEFVHMYKIYS